MKATSLLILVLLGIILSLTNAIESKSGKATFDFNLPAWAVMKAPPPTVTI